MINQEMPKDVELETVVLGAILLEEDAIHEVIESLNENLFFDPFNKEVCKSILNIHAVGGKLDILTITNDFRSRNVKDEEGNLPIMKITSLTNRVAQAHHIQYHTKILQQMAMRRNIISVTQLVNLKAYNNSIDVFELLTELENALDTNINQGAPAVHLHPAAKRMYENSLQLQETGEVKGFPIASNNLSKYLHAFQKGKTYVFAGRPAMGKTAAALSDAVNGASLGYPCAYFSLEVGEEEMCQRIIANLSGVNAEKIQLGKFQSHEKEVIQKAVNDTKDIPLYIEDLSTLNVSEFRSKCKRLKNKHGVEAVFVDYLQLMNGVQKGNREQEIASISRACKQIAKELDIAVIELAQLSRSVESTADKKPMLQHLRESGAIEQDADVVIFLYRPFYYDITEDEDGRAFDKGSLCYIVAKHRGGRTGEAWSNIDLATSKVKDKDLFV